MYKKNSIQKFIKHKKNLLPAFILLVGAVLIFESASISQRMGNLFFGGTPALYNVTFAQFFFRQAAYPLLGKPMKSAHYQLSRTYFIQGNLYTALDEVKRELEIYPENTRAYYILGLTYGYMNKEDKAIEAFSKFIETNPTSWAARNDKAWLQFRIGDIDGALTTLKPVAQATKIPWIQNTYGALLMNKGKYREAEEAFLNAKRVADTMTEESWGIAYPGNDPRIYATGLNAMKLSIDENLAITQKKLGK